MIQPPLSTQVPPRTRPMNRRRFLTTGANALAGLTATQAIGLQGLLGSSERAAGHVTVRRLELRFLTCDPAFVDTRPCFAPSGDAVLFMRAPAGNDPAATATSNLSPWSLWKVPVDGGAPEPFFEHAHVRATRPDWSWTTGTIAFSAVRDDGTGEVWLVDESGRGVTHVPVDAPFRGQLFYPSWYPDGDALAVTDYRRNQLLRVDVPSGAAVPLTEPEQVLAGMCSVAPRARAAPPLIAFAGQPPGADYHASRNSIWVRTTEGTTRELLPGQGRMPWWSPTGRRIAFASTRGRPAPAVTVQPRTLPDGIPSIFIADVPVEESTASSAVGVTPLDHRTTFARWSPDATHLVYRAIEVDGDRSGIAVVDLRALSTS